jgi:hypothetical protein
MFKFVCLALLVAYAAAGKVDTESCGGVSGFLEATIEGCDGGGTCVVKKETPTQITVKFTASEDIPDGKYLIVALYLGLNIEITNKNLCDGVGGGCPIKAGQEILHTHVMTLPSSVPNIKATTSLKISDGSGNSHVCRSLEVEITA